MGVVGRAPGDVADISCPHCHTDRVCCFTVLRPLSLVGRLLARPVHVSHTTVFARMLRPGVQGLAYGMNLKTSQELAMVLPLPIAPGRGEDAVSFVDLSAHPQMFSDFHHLFAMQVLAAKGGFARAPKSTLVVHEIGSFIASYVPMRADFARLDPRFRMPDVLFEAVPRYADYGFAVFQLRPGKVTVHPMGLTFPTRDDRLFFPTVHLHDGRFHARAKFDHALYYQLPRITDVGPAFFGAQPEAEVPSYMKPHETYEGLVDVDAPLARRILRGKLANDDTWIS